MTARHQEPPRGGGAEPLKDDIVLLTVREVAALLRLTEAGVYSLVAQRKIPHFKISNRVRFTRSDVVAWLERNRVPSRERP